MSARAPGEAGHPPGASGRSASGLDQAVAVAALDEVELGAGLLVLEPDPMFVHLWVPAALELEVEPGLDASTEAPSGTYRFEAGVPDVEEAGFVVALALAAV